MQKKKANCLKKQPNAGRYEQIGGDFSTNEFLKLLYNFISIYKSCVTTSINVVNFNSKYFLHKSQNACFNNDSVIIKFFEFEKLASYLIRGYIDSKSDFNKRIYLLRINSLIASSVPVFNLLSEYLGSISNTFIYRNIVLNKRVLSIINPSLKKNGGLYYDMLISTFGYVNKFFNQYYSLFLNHYSLSDNVYGFVKNKSCADNAKYHLANSPKSLINIDINKFFNNCTIIKTIENNVYSDTLSLFDCPPLLKSNFNFMIMSLFSFLTHNSVYPTGSSFTPVLSNIMMLPIDLEITKYLSPLSGVRYSRYADDISISSNAQKINNKNVLNIDTIKDIEKILNKYSFYIKYKKTTIFSAGDAKVINGINLDLVNNKLSIGSSRKLVIRDAYMEMKASGIKDYGLLGLLSYIRDVSPKQYKYIIGET